MTSVLWGQWNADVKTPFNEEQVIYVQPLL